MLSAEYFFRTGFKFCLVSDKTLGVFSFFKACSQHSIVSILSAGLKIFKFGIDLKPLNCSTGWWVGPSSPRPIESCVIT